MKARIDVMNNDDLRRVIWSYLRKKPYRKCQTCDRVCMWDTNRTIYKFVYIGGFIHCMKCFNKNFLLSHPDGIWDKKYY